MSALGMFWRVQAGRKRSVTVFTALCLTYSQLSGRQETIVSALRVMSRRSISPLATSFTSSSGRAPPS